MIHLRTLNLEPLDCYHQDGHYSLKRRLSEDKAVYDFVSKHFDEWVEEPENKTDFEIGKAYVVSDQDKKIAMIGSCQMDSNGIIDLWCAIDQKYRRQGYGEKILAQITEYLVENITNLTDIRLVINKINEGSNKVATYCGYQMVDQYNNNNVYQYFAK